MTTSAQLAREFNDFIGYVKHKYDHEGIINNGFSSLLEGLNSYTGQVGTAVDLVTKARDLYASTAHPENDETNKAQVLDLVQQAKAQVVF